MDRKKILFVPHSDESTDASRELLLIVSHLDQKLYEPLIVVDPNSTLREEYERSARPILAGDTRRQDSLPGSIKSMARKWRVLRAVRPDCLYCNTIMTAGWLLCAKLLNIPAIVHVHEHEHESERLTSLERYLLHNFTDSYIASSSTVRKYLMSVSGLPPSRIVLFHESIEMPDAATGSHPDGEAGTNAPVVVGVAGPLSQTGGADLFLDAVKPLVARFAGRKAVKFLIAGNVREADRLFVETLRTKVVQEQLTGDVQFDLGDRAPEAYLAASDVVVFPSREAVLPLLVPQTMALGKPVVSFAVGGVTEAVGRDAGLVVPAGDVRAMSEAIAQLIDDTGMRDRLGAGARKRASERFDITRNITTLQQIIDSVLATA